jgi:hypothetical protein
MRARSGAVQAAVGNMPGMRLKSLPLYVVVLIAAGCGGTKSAAPPPTATTHATTSNQTTTASANALQAEANAAATGDIPDNQVFLTFQNRAAAYSIRYPEGWTQHGSGGDVTFQDKNNLVHIVVGKGGAPTPTSVSGQLKALKASNPSLAFQPPKTVRIGSSQVVKATYTTQSAPNPVTGKRVTLTVDRYELAKGGRRAVVDLGTPRGVDNVDAYRMMIASFRWH